MDKNTIIEMLVHLNSNNPADCEGDLNVLCDINVRQVCKQCDINLENLCQLNENLYKFNKRDNSMIWSYICLNFYLLKLLKESLDSTPSGDVLSVQHAKLLKNVIKNIVAIGIKCNLQPRMPTYRKLPTQYVEEVEPILNSYNRLTATTYGLITCLKCIKLRSVILSDSLKPILSSLYQIVYCPLKKPDESGEKMINSSFVMTRELYNRFTVEKDFFRKELEYLENSLLKSLYVRETMLLPESNSPVWFMKSISQNLNAAICSPRGIETIARAMLDSSVDYDPNDKAKTWKILEVMAKLLLNFHGKSEFEDSICKQLINLLDIKDRNGKYIVPFENLYVLCVKKLFHLDENACKNTLLPPILNQITRFSDKGHKFSDGEDVTDSITRVIRMLYSCFAENSVENLPIGLLTPSINILIYLYIMTSHSSLSGLQNELQEILTKFVNENDDKKSFFDLFLFDILWNEVNAFRNDIYLKRSNTDLIVKKCDFKNLININTRGEMLIKICRCQRSLSITLFMYLLSVLTDQDKYLKTSNKDLLEVESEFILDEVVQKKLVVYQLLSELAEDELIQNYIKGHPIDLIKYFENILHRTLNSGIHKIDESDSENFQTIFTLLMVLQALVMNSKKRDDFKGLLDVLNFLFKESINVEFRNLLKSIIDLLTEKSEKREPEHRKSELEKAIDDVCDPLLPVRGHGLMTFAKLIETKDPEAMNRKNYILNIFQQNLKNDDSFIYLSAINGLAAMGYIFPDVVLNILTDEYSDFDRKEDEGVVELRMKLGEILLRITKTLGEVAPKYKSLLLNTFLVGAKDDDHMIRASSLSNLGEVCKVLGYKLGTIVTEILVCVHAIITTDKAVEARRAAVTVIRQLLAGLEVETITFLKDHILEIYRTLKTIYQGDKDDIMRLQAQLALEELNENVKDFLMTASRLEGEKIFVLPDRKDIVYKF